MKIKALQMQGFKSFGDRTELRFDTQIVGIVGPNGCGKSNIVDAIRWAMGEQSAKGLRGSEMADVIFNGTSTRKRASFAEVSLIFDNADKQAPAPYTDCAEVMITRRLYRSGESEYLINKVTVRLKDITDLFLGTGSSARAYSIVAQGKVDQIVLAKPEDRRFLLEEAAGVAKYKARKVAAERKMEATRENLVRIDDIVRELERSAKHLERQVGRAEQFRKIQTELRQLDEQIVAAKVTQLDRRAAENDERRTHSQAQFERVSTELSKSEAEIEAWRLSALHQEKLSTTDYENLLNTKERFLSADKEIELAHQRISNLKNQITERSKDIDRIQSKVQENAEALQQVIQDRENLARTKESSERELEALKSQVAETDSKILSLEGELIAVQKALDEQIAIAAKEAQKREIYLQDRVHLELRRAEIEGELEHLTTLETEFATRRADHERILSELESEVLRLEDEWSKLQSQQADQFERQQGLFQERGTIQEMIAACEGELKSLQTLEEHEVGYEAGAIERKKRSGLPLVMDLVQFKSDFQSVGEAFLHEFGQCFLTLEDATDTADEIRWSALLTRNAKVFSRSLLDCVEGSVAEPLQSVLRSIELVDELTDAPHPQMNFKGELRLPGASGLETRSRGHIRLKETPFGRKSELSRFETQKVELVKRLNEIEQSLFGIKDSLAETASGLEGRREEIRVKSAQLGERRSLLATSIAQAEAQKFRFNERNQELTQLDQELLDLEFKIHAATVASSTKELDEKKFTIVEALQQQKAAKSTLDTQWVEKRIAFGALQERLERLDQRSISAEMTQSEYNHNQSIYKNDIDLWSREIEMESERIQQLSVRRAQDEDQIKEIERRLAESKQVLNSVRSQIEQAEVARKDTTKEKESLQATVQELELEHQRLKFEVEELAQIVQERYHISLQEIIAAVKPEDLERLEDQTILGSLEVDAKELRDKIEKFGEVNLLAISEFEEINQRLQFMSKQREDLLKTLDTLQSIIDRVNKITEFRFRETFKAINHNFQVLFPKLFGGGRAYMTLTNENDLLETGVEIFAEPPGKKIQAMSLLSGGEKAMTSISLIFSLFAYRPSSFCILDEVDAPLDEINTARYNGIIKDMASLSQFIVITHNKRTMEVADTLFGVTMQEAGVSTLVGVQLNEARAFVASGAPTAA